MSESDEQAVVVQYFRLKWPQYLITSIPNGGYMLAGSKWGRIRQMKRLKKEGLEPGMPDLVIWVSMGGWHGLLLEMKIKGKTKSALGPEQKAKIEYLNWQKYKTVMCAGADEAIKAIDDYMALDKSEYDKFMDVCDWGSE